MFGCHEASEQEACDGCVDCHSHVKIIWYGNTDNLSGGHIQSNWHTGVHSGADYRSIRDGLQFSANGHC